MSLLTSFLIAALGLIAVRAIGRRSPVLTFIVLATLLVLPLIAMLPKVHLTLPAVASVAVEASSGYLFPLYSLGVILFGGKLLLDYFSFQRWAHKSLPFTPEQTHICESLADAQERLRYQKPIRIRLHPSLASPVAAGLLRPTIYLPEEALGWERETLRAVLLHELGHHVRRDLWTSLGARLACVLHWFNPLAWLLRREHLEQCEYACDERVLSTGIDAKSYAHTLCNLALPQGASTPPLALAMATKSGLRNRVENLLAPRRPLTFLPIAATLILTLGTALALSTLRPALEKTFPLGGDYSAQEVELRLTANPFPGN